MKKFEIIDSAGVVEDRFRDLEDASLRLDELLEEGFEFEGDIKIVEVHFITR